MSFLAGRLAATEGAYFLQESKHAVGRLVEKNKKLLPNPNSPSSAPKVSPNPPPYLVEEAQSDVLPEVLRHSLPSKIFQPASDSSISRSSKWVLPSDPKKPNFVSPDALNPLRAYVSLPQVTFGPKRWEFPVTEHSVVASTANELRRDNYMANINPEKLKAAAEGFSQIGKAFAVATAMIFGSATMVFVVAASKLELHNSDDIRVKGRDLVQPKFENLREQLIPVKVWADNMSKKWHLNREETIKGKPMVKELSKILGAKTSN